ncbi:DciA family protein [Streptomyces sp. NPDC029674]|uniref:DciA family protein n=1 Tax=Streptomyces sp. NPDC029674 TaxID=3365297 RepID=UPI00384E3834
MEAAQKNGSSQKAKAGPYGAAQRVRADGSRSGDRRAGHRAGLGAPGRRRHAAGPVGCPRPQFTGYVVAVSYAPGSGRLAVCPESTAWATKARLEQPRIIAAANQAAGRTVVSSLWILPRRRACPQSDRCCPGRPGPGSAHRAREDPKTAWEGYRRALAAHQEVAPPRWVDPGRAKAVDARLSRCGNADAAHSLRPMLAFRRRADPV